MAPIVLSPPHNIRSLKLRHSQILDKHNPTTSSNGKYSLKEEEEEEEEEEEDIMPKKAIMTNGCGGTCLGLGFSGAIYGKTSFINWTMEDIVYVAKYHWPICFFGACLLFFMGVEYTLLMVPSDSPPFDIGFIATRSLNRWLAASPELNTILAGLNTVFVGMQTTYILWTWLIEGRPRATISALFMFTCRGILGYSTQLPLPQGFLGSGVDFPVGNVSFFLFFSGHVAGSVIASLDMRRMQRWQLAWIFDALNALQVIRLLGTRGHYTIDLVVGVGAGILFDSLAGNYEESKIKIKNKGGNVVNGSIKEVVLN